MSDLFKVENNGAEFSPCCKYRYKLWRIWDDSKQLVMFIGLNPSTANQSTNDPTIRRVMSMAKSWGYGGVYMMNLFSFVTPYPKELKKNEFTAYWFENRENLVDIASLCEKVIFAWGNFEEALDLGKEAAQRFPDAYCLVKNKNGSPKHPLYVKSDVVPIKYNEQIKNNTQCEII